MDSITIPGQQRQEIARLRRALKPTPVRLHHLPNWFRLALIRKFGCSRFGTSGWAVIDHVLRRATWLDHYGSTTLADGRLAFVSEPYGFNETEALLCDCLADELGCNYWPTDNSWHFPGRTIRIVFAQSQLSDGVRTILRPPRLCPGHRRELLAQHGYPLPRSQEGCRKC